MRRDQALCEDFGLDFFRADSLPGIQGAHTFKQSLFESALLQSRSALGASRDFLGADHL